MKKAFSFTLSSFCSQDISFFVLIFGHIKKQLDLKDIVNLKIYEVIAWETIAIDILPSKSRCKCNQTMKFGLLIEYNIRNISLEKPYTKYGREIFPNPFLKAKNWAYLWINILKFCTVSFYCVTSWGLSKESLFKLCCFFKALVFTSHKAFLENKKSSGTSLPAYFLHDFWRKTLL